MRLCGSAILWRLLFSLVRLRSQSGQEVPKSTDQTGWSGNGPEIQWNLTSMFPLDVKMKCNTDINVASITTQQRNENWSTGTSGWTLTSCSRIPPSNLKPPLMASYVQASAFHHGWPGAGQKWLLLGMKVSSYSSGEGLRLIFEINHLSWWCKGSWMCVRVQGLQANLVWKRYMTAVCCHVTCE